MKGDVIPKKNKNWVLPTVITIIGISAPLIIGLFQLWSAEKIALNERKMKMWELFSRDLLNVDYKEEVWKTEGTVRLLGAMLSDTSTLEDESLINLARAIFRESIITSIGQFHRTEEIRINAARVIASMYHIDKKFIIDQLIHTIKEDTTYPGYFRINGAIVVTLAKIPDYWEGTVEQKKKIEQLRDHRYLGEKQLTKDYKQGWLEDEALKKWRPIKQNRLNQYYLQKDSSEITNIKGIAMTSNAPLIISLLSFTIALLTYFIHRIINWRNRYWDRWAFLGKMVIEKPCLMRVWCSQSQYQKEFANNNDPISPEERIFAELYLDFYLEVNSLNGFSSLLVGKYPGRVNISNPLITKVYNEYVKDEYLQPSQTIIERGLVQE